MGDKNRHIEVGDMVRVYGEDYSLFIVLEVEDFSDDELIDMDFKLAKIYPQSQNLILSIEGMDDVSLFEKRGTESYNRKMRFVEIDRETKGWGEAKYINIIKDSLKNDNLKNSKRDSDEIDYSPPKTINECLDMINDLDFLHNQFGGEEYLEAKKLVFERLAILSE